MTFRYLLIYFWAFLCSAFAFSADQIDSLKKVLDQPIPKVERALTLIKLAEFSDDEISDFSLKYAFKETDSGEITVSVKESDGLVEVVLGDNGPGFDFEKYHYQKETLGIELITTLVEQLDGELSYSKEDGSFYTIKFAV